MPVSLATPGSPDQTKADVEIGLLDLLSGSARASGLRQITGLLEKAAGPTRVRLRLFALPGAANADRDGSHAATAWDLRALLGSRLDGLFVTGAEPRALRLPDEPFWPYLIDVLDWARTNTRTTIWSCLAAHAAVLHLDRVERMRLPQKCSGAFAVEGRGDHPLLADLARPARVFHSRWNDVAERDLAAAGYQILTRCTVGVDSFVKSCGSRFVFLQGHPEYDADALGREYRRDIRRFLSGASDWYPPQPTGYFGEAMADALHRFEARARRERRPETILHAPLRLEGSEDAASQTAFGETLFRNWLRMVTADASEHAVA